jgi:hypothetical protein
MDILRDIPIVLSVEQVLEAQGGRRRKVPDKPAIVAEVQQAIELAQTLYAPAAIYAELALRGVKDDGRVTLVCPDDGGEEHVLDVGPHADLLAPAERAFVTVYTIGPALEAQVAQFNQAGEMLAAYWLDSVGVLALGAVSEALRCIAEERAAERGWGVGAALSPGSLVGWSVQGQRELCALLPLSEIGVRLNKHCVLEPHKSVSVLIGLGPGYESHQVGSVCRFCSLADTCWRRR